MGERHAVVPRTLCLVFESALRERVLLIEYAARKGKVAGMSNCLGGHIEKGEDIVASAVREVVEESGCAEADIAPSAALAGVVHVADFFNVQVMMFVVTMELSIGSTVAAPDYRYQSSEGIVSWVPVESVSSRKVFDDVPLILERCQRTTAAEDCAISRDSPK